MSKPRHRLHPLILLCSLTLLTTSCTTAFNHHWRQATNNTPTNPTDLTGAWQGTWHSESTGHHGKLRAIATPIPNQPHTWQFRYHATWAKILNGGYTTQHIATPQPDSTYQLSGQHHLGKLFGGTFHYGGTATPHQFTATYRSNSDHGTFKMSRPKP